VVATPALPGGHYVVTADLTVAGSDPAGSAGGTEIACWVVSSGGGSFTNRDGVQIEADIGPATQSLSLADLVTTAEPGNEIDLVCSLSSSGGAKTEMVTVTRATIIAMQVTNTTSSTSSTPPGTDRR
jgi:hypothetical protein